MPCPVCGREDCHDPAHHLPAELLTNILARVPPSPAISLVATAWYDAVPSCIVAAFIEVPTGILQAAWSPFSRSFSCSFVIKASFALHPAAPPGTRLTQGQYRQLVRGRFRRNGHDVPHRLPFGARLDPVQFQLDGPGNTADVYGQRREGLGRANWYCTDLADVGRRGAFNPDGAYFFCSDMPGIRGDPGDVIEVDLEFQGLLIDTALGRIIATRTWHVQGRYVVPMSQGPTAADAAKSLH